MGSNVWRVGRCNIVVKVKMIGPSKSSHAFSATCTFRTPCNLAHLHIYLSINLVAIGVHLYFLSNKYHETHLFVVRLWALQIISPIVIGPLHKVQSTCLVSPIISQLMNSWKLHFFKCLTGVPWTLVGIILKRQLIKKIEKKNWRHQTQYD